MQSGEDSAYRPTPANQSRARALIPAEIVLANALLEIFAAGRHDIADVASAIRDRGVERPSGAPGDWDAQALETELRAINQSLDAAYAARHEVVAGATRI